MSFSGGAGGRREGGCAGGFPPEVPIEFRDAERVTLENWKRYVRFKRPKRCSRYKDVALCLLEFFHNKGVYTGIYPSPYKENFSPQASRAEISERGVQRAEISERGGGRGEGESESVSVRVKQMTLDEVIESLSEEEREVVEEVGKQVERWWVKRIGSEFPEYLKAITPMFVLYLQERECYDVRIVLYYGDGEEEEVRIPYKTRFSERYRREVEEKLSGIKFKRCTHLIIPTNMNVYREIISATRALKRRWDILWKRIKRELDDFHKWYWKMVDWLEKGEIPEDYFAEYLHSLPFDLNIGIPATSKEVRFLCVLEFALKEGHGMPHLHILIENVFFNKNGIRMIREEELKGHTNGFKMRRYFNLDICDYVLKYVKKALVVNLRRGRRKFTSSEIRKFVHASLYWITGCHMYSVSRNVQEEIKERISGGEEEEKDYIGRYEGLVLARDRFEKHLKERDYVMYCFYERVDEFHVEQFAFLYFEHRIERVVKEILSEWNDYLT